MANASFATRTIGSGAREGETVPVDTPTNIHALLEFAGGATVTLSASWDVWTHRHANMELYGTEGSIFVPDPNFFAGTVELADVEGNVAALEAGDHPFGVNNMTDSRGEERANYRCAGLADMAAAIDAGRPHRCNIDLALHAVDVMVSILKAGEERRWVTLSTTCERPAALSAAEAAALMV
jgi:predicted dehydrogenase